MRKPTHCWTRLASSKWEDAWIERLRFLGPGAVAVVSRPGSRLIRLQAWCDAGTARRLEKAFGGSSRKASTLLPPLTSKPVAIRGRLVIYAEHAAWSGHSRVRCRAGCLPVLIPAGMAFGTGSHATTATVLRMLCDAARPAGFRAADLGTGTGVLAIAMEKLGAACVTALDNDRAAVRIARSNARLNGCRRCRFEVADVGAWGPGMAFDLITANLYSELLIAAAPCLANALAPGGTLLFSGVLRDQQRAVARALRAAGLVVGQPLVRGKWCAGQAQRPKNVGGKTSPSVLNRDDDPSLRGRGCRIDAPGGRRGR